MIAELDPIVPRPGSEWQEGAQGVFTGFSAETYHKAYGVSHSMLRHMEPPARLPAYLTEPRVVTADMVLGTLTHHMILEPDKPMPKVVLQPDTYPAQPDSSAVKAKKAAVGDPLEWHNSAKYCKRWHAEAHASGLIVLTSDRMDSLRGMVKSVSLHPGARAASPAKQIRNLDNVGHALAASLPVRRVRSQLSTASRQSLPRIQEVMGVWHTHPMLNRFSPSSGPTQASFCSIQAMRSTSVILSPKGPLDLQPPQPPSRPLPHP